MGRSVVYKIFNMTRVNLPGSPMLNEIDLLHVVPVVPQGVFSVVISNFIGLLGLDLTRI